MRTRASYRSSGVSVYNMQIIIRDGATTNPCFVPITVRILIQRNRYRPEFSSSSVTITIRETHDLNQELVTIRVRVS